MVTKGQETRSVFTRWKKYDEILRQMLEEDDISKKEYWENEDELEEVWEIKEINKWKERGRWMGRGEQRKKRAEEHRE